MSQTSPEPADAPVPSGGRIWDDPNARQVLDTMGEYFVALDRDHTLAFVNRSLAVKSRQGFEGFVGRNHWDIWPEMRGTIVEHSYERAFATGIAQRFEFFHAKSGIWIDVNACPVGDYLHLYFHDVTQEKLAQDELVQAQRRLHALVSNAPVILFATDADGIVTLAEGSGLKTINRSSADLLGKSIFDLPEALIETQIELRRVLAGEASRWITAIGPFFFEVTSSPVRNEKGLPNGLIGVAIDITERRRTEEALRESEDHYRFRVLTSPLMPWLANPEGYLYEHSDQWLALTGMTREESLDNQITVVHPDDKLTMLQAWCRCLETGEPFDFEHRIKVANGEYRWMRSRAIARLNPQGEILRWYGTTEDIHDRKSSIETLQRTQESLALAMKGGRMGWWVRDLVTEAVTWSPELEALFGVPPGAFRGTREQFIENVHPEDRAMVTAAVVRAIETGEDYSVEFRFRRADGTHGWMDGRGRAEYDSMGRPLTLYGIGIDITERKLVEEALREANEELERRVRERTAELQAANDSLTGFTYHVSHDLRAPLRAIVSTSKMVEEDYSHALPEEAGRLLARQAIAASKLGQLIDDLLKLSRLSQSEISRVAVDLTAIAQDATEEALSSHPGTAVTVAIEEDMVVEADPRLVKLALANLIENAVKYSPNGGAVKVGRHLDGPFYVSDEGIGIAPEYFLKIFEPFERLHRDEEFRGTGVGLSNVLQVIKRHGGNIWVESEIGKGATFLFTLGPSGLGGGQ